LFIFSFIDLFIFHRLFLEENMQIDGIEVRILIAK
jgi:hypothetical protein